MKLQFQKPSRCYFPEWFKNHKQPILRLIAHGSCAHLKCLFSHVQNRWRRKFFLNAAKLIGCQCSEISPQVQGLGFSWCVKHLYIKKVRLPFLAERNISGLLPPKPPTAPSSECQSFWISGNSSNKCLFVITAYWF